MLRKLIILSLCMVLLLSFTGCGFKKKIEGKLAEKITEGVLDKVAGEDTKVDLDDGKITVKGEDGSEFTIDSNEWPEGKAIDLIPEFKHGKIASTMNTDAYCVVNIEEVDQKDFDEYLELIKDKGYTKDSMDMSSEELISYYASSEKDKSTINISYSMERKEMMLTISIED